MLTCLGSVIRSAWTFKGSCTLEILLRGLQNALKPALHVIRPMMHDSTVRELSPPAACRQWTRAARAAHR